jgi:hypothetical protein
MILVAFERTAQSHQGLLGACGLKELDTFPKLNRRIDLYRDMDGNQESQVVLALLNLTNDIHAGILLGIIQP